MMLTDTANPLIPVYLNQRIVFDLLAMLQDGIATVTKISERSRNELSSSNDLDASFGLSKTLSSLLAVNLSGKRGKTSTDEAGTTRDEERVHTPASLFFKLRELLDRRKLLKIDSPDFVPRPGDLIEFTSALKRNPIVEAIDFMAGAMEMGEVFIPEPAKRGKQQGGIPQNENRKIQLQMAKLSGDLKSGGTVDLTTGTLQCKYRAVITAETASLIDPTMSDLVDGTFSVVGKVVRSLPEGSDEFIKLTRKATMGRLAGAQIEELFSQISLLKTEHDFDIPDLEWKLHGPVIQVLPISIFA